MTSARRPAGLKCGSASISRWYGNTAAIDSRTAAPIVEESDNETLFRDPRHPYTRALLDSVLTPDPSLGVPDTHLGAAYPNPLDMPSGCTFHPRCAKVMDQCSKIAPTPIATDCGHVECHLYDEEQKAGRLAS